MDVPGEHRAVERKRGGCDDRDGHTVGEDLEHSLARAIDGIVCELGLPRPDVERVGMALTKLRGYMPAPATSPN